jgi:four helix bundle protein
MVRHNVRTHFDLDVYQRAFSAAMQVYELSEQFPIVERYSLTDQIRRASRSVCANLAEAWRKRRYEAAFAGKLSDAEAEAAETQTWLQFAAACGYLDASVADELTKQYDSVLRTLVGINCHRSDWTIK